MAPTPLGDLPGVGNPRPWEIKESGEGGRFSSFAEMLRGGGRLGESTSGLTDRRRVGSTPMRDRSRVLTVGESVVGGDVGFVRPSRDRLAGGMSVMVSRSTLLERGKTVDRVGVVG